ncbi:uncharacterized protein V1513DRAFT_460588 [Lipomyces chichibuensis]|uniref:uncharacterized protein n=1 Tax=Lipomyces chichibuensis TaxID=1546026 RepID=UPI0033432D40
MSVVDNLENMDRQLTIVRHHIDIASLAPATRPTSRHRTLMQRTKLIGIVRRSLSPDTQVEVPATREEYYQVHPQLLYDSARSVAIVIAAPSPRHRSRLCYFSTWTDETGTRAASHGLTTRAWDTALSYTEIDDNDTLMIAIEVGVSQSHEGLRAAISCRGLKPTIRYYDSVSDIDGAIERIRREFRDQLKQNPYGTPLESVVLQTLRCPPEGCAPETLLDPTQSFELVRSGAFVGMDIPPNQDEVVLGDCIPSHVLSDEQIEARPVNFFRRDWFEAKFRISMLRYALQRLRAKALVRQS